MRLRRNIPLILFFIIVFHVDMVLAKSYRNSLKYADKLFREKKYDEAQKQYLDIQLEHPNDPVLSYNIGNTLYKQKKYDEAVESYKKSLVGSTPQIQAKANYNIGNSIYQKAVQTESTGKLDQAVKEMREAVEFYKSSIKVVPDDYDTKKNIEFIQQEIKRLLNTIKEQAEKQNQQGDQNQQQQQNQHGDQNQQGQDNNQQQSQQQQASGKKDNKSGEKDNEAHKQQAQQQKQGEQENEGNNQQIAKQEGENEGQNTGENDNEDKKQGQELSKREAEQLLKNMEDGDKKKRTKPLEKGYLGEVEKDW